MRLPALICEAYLQGANTRIIYPGRGGSGHLFTGEKCLCMRCKKITRDLFRAMSLAPRQKCPRDAVEMKEAMTGFFGSDSIAICCHCREIKNYFGRSFDGSVFSREYSVLELAKNRSGMV